MRVAVANIAKYLTPAQTLADTRQAFRDGEVVIANELSNPSHRMIFLNTATRHRSQLVHPKQKVQVAVPEEWHAYGARYQLSRSWQPVNPARYMNVVYCPDENTIYCATHLTNGAWNQRHRFTKKLRRKLWLRQERVMQDHVQRWHDLGWNVVVAGDMNRFSPPGLHARQVAVSEEYMHIVCIPARGNLVQLSDEVVRFKVQSDHPQLSVNVRFVKK
jgi:hypothetical protein